MHPVCRAAALLAPILLAPVVTAQLLPSAQSRVALMSKLAANAGLDTSNVPQLPLPQAPQQPQVQAGVVGWPVSGPTCLAGCRRLGRLGLPVSSSC